MNRKGINNELRSKSLNGGVITTSAQATLVVMQFISTAFLARMLSPSDYGIIAMVVAVTAFAAIFQDLGLSAATVQSKNLTHKQKSNLFWLNLLLGCALTCILALLSPIIALFYGNDEVFLVALTMSLTFLISSLGAQSKALLDREMLFGKVAAAKLAAALLGAVVSIYLAWVGFGYWSLVCGVLSNRLLNSLLLLVFHDWRPSKPSRNSGMMEMVKFGRNVTGFNLVNYFSRNLDNILVGKYCGSASLGLYSRAYALLMLPITNIRGPINTVTFPALSRLQDQPDEFRSFYRVKIKIIAILSMPVVTLMFVESDPLVLLILGEKWLGSAPIFSVLALAALFQPVCSTRGVVMLACGDSRRYLTMGCCVALLVSFGFLVGVRYGPMGVAVSYVITQNLIIYPVMRYAFKNTPLKLGDFFVPVLYPLMACLIAGVGAYGALEGVVDLNWSSASVLIFVSIVFMIIYLGVLIFREEGRSDLRFVSQFITNKITR